MIGAHTSADKTNEWWIDKEKLIVLRFIKFDGDNKEEGIFSAHQRYGNAWSETACDFYVNDKLVQREKYHDCRANVEIDPGLFDPLNFRMRGGE